MVVFATRVARLSDILNPPGGANHQAGPSARGTMVSSCAPPAPEVHRTDRFSRTLPQFGDKPFRLEIIAQGQPLERGRIILQTA